ncbi:hypothetical protein [Mycolicibacterium wolinskyi]|uniref:hypothetical protein n=1 Tax=Mycolicibacterium wolinskyi TaxID=59750 RepID=UPI003917B45D
MGPNDKPGPEPTARNSAQAEAPDKTLKDRLVGGALFLASIYVVACAIWVVIATSFNWGGGTLAGGGMALLGIAVGSYVAIYKDAIGAKNLTRWMIARAVSIACVAMILAASVDIDISDDTVDASASPVFTTSYGYYNYYTYGCV